MKRAGLKLVWIAVVLAGGIPAWAQSCDTRDEIPDAARTSMESAAQQVFAQASNGDVNSLRGNAIPSLQSGFEGVAAAVNDNKAALSGAKPQLRTSFLLDTGATPSADGLFFCGVFGAGGQSGNGANFALPGLPVGKYGIVIQDFIGSKGPYSLTSIFQEMNGWKLAGFYIYPESAVGHDGIWYLQRARESKGKGQNHSAWFYYQISWTLLAPIKFMNSGLLDKVMQEWNGIQLKDVPAGGQPVSYAANGKTYSISDMSVLPTEKTLDLSIKYSAASTANVDATRTEARNLATSIVTQYPELKDVFNNVWVHATDANGGDVVGLINLKPAAQ